MRDRFAIDSQAGTPRIPRVYLPPHGGPLNWRDETSGELRRAVRAYLDYRTSAPRPDPTPAQLALVIEWLRYYIAAPCWRDDGQGGLARSREAAARLETRDDVSRWLALALDLGIDPL